MSKKSLKLFKDFSISNNVSRNGFDLSFSNKFTAKCGELLPIMHRTVMPGDVFKINLSTFTRTRPVQTAAFSKINEYYDFFFVPYRLLGKHIPHILAQDTSNPTTALSSSSSNVINTQLPHFLLNDMRSGVLSEYSVVHYLRGTTELGRANEFGFSRLALSHKLMNYLGYCNVSTSEIKRQLNDEVFSMFSVNSFVSLLPLASYQKIYYDFYRNTQWEDNVPYNYNFDYMSSSSRFVLPTTEQYWSNPTLFDLRYSNYPKDIFYGLLPDSQLGDTSVVSTLDADAESWTPLTDIDGTVVEVANGVDGRGNLIKGKDDSLLLPGSELGFNMADAFSKFNADFSILELRKAKAVQKYREIMGTGRRDYKSIIQKVFNVDTPDTLSDMCTYLGGHSSVIKISEVDNTNLVSDSEAIPVSESAIQRGKGLGSSQSNLIEFEAKEFGCIMCIYHAQPQMDYMLNAFHFDTMKVSVDDFANPVFDKLGLQEFNGVYLDNSNGTFPNPGSTFIGWSPRYYDYKTSIDVINGDFRESLRDWVAPLDKDIILQYNRDVVSDNPNLQLTNNFFKVNPSILDSIFDVIADSWIDTDQLRVSVDFNINAVRNLDYIGLPY